MRTQTRQGITHKSQHEATRGAHPQTMQLEAPTSSQPVMKTEKGSCPRSNLQIQAGMLSELPDIFLTQTRSAKIPTEAKYLQAASSRRSLSTHWEVSFFDALKLPPRSTQCVPSLASKSKDELGDA